MKIKIYFNRSVHENAANYYQLGKEAKKKIEGIDVAIKETEKEIKNRSKVSTDKKVRHKRAKEWFEKFHWFRTSENKLVIGGRSAQQNDGLYAKHFDSGDLFFHADIQGGSATIIKEATNATDQEKLEAAQMAGCFSNAWKNGNASVDVYCVKRDQVSKHSPGGFIPSGAFAIIGEREWFRGMKLALRIGKGPNGIEIIPDLSTKRLENELVLVPTTAGKDKGQLTKSLAKRFDVHPDELLELLPNGKSKTVEMKK